MFEDVVKKAQLIILRNPDVFQWGEYKMSNKMFSIRFTDGTKAWLSPYSVIESYGMPKTDINNELDRYNFYIRIGELDKAQDIIRELRGEIHGFE